MHPNPSPCFFKRNWKRYPNDRFIMWTKSLSDLHDFHQLLNQLEPSIQYETKYSQCELEFLDLKVLLNDGKISLDIYYKNTDTHQYVPFNSCHPRHTKTNIPYNEARRICTIVENTNRKATRLDELGNFLKARDYPDSLISMGILRALSVAQESLRKDRKN